MNFSERLKQELKRNEMTQSDLSSTTGLCVATISNYARGNYLPRAEELIILSQTLNVPIDYLLGNVIREENEWK